MHMPVVVQFLQQSLLVGLKDFFLMPVSQTSGDNSASFFAIPLAMNISGAPRGMKQPLEWRIRQKTSIEHSSPCIWLHVGFIYQHFFWVVWSAKWLQIEGAWGLKPSVQCAARDGLGVTSSSISKALVQVQKEAKLQGMNTDGLHLLLHNSNNGEYERVLIKRIDLWPSWETQQIRFHLLAFQWTSASSRGWDSTRLTSSN